MMRSRYGLQSLIFWVEKNHDWIKKNLDFSERHFDADNKSVAALVAFDFSLHTCQETTE